MTRNVNMTKKHHRLFSAISVIKKAALWPLTAPQTAFCSRWFDWEFVSFMFCEAEGGVLAQSITKETVAKLFFSFCFLTSSANPSHSRQLQASAELKRVLTLLWALFVESEFMLSLSVSPEEKK